MCGLGAAGITPSGLSLHCLNLSLSRVRTLLRQGPHGGSQPWATELSREAARAKGRVPAGNQGQGTFVFPDTCGHSLAPSFIIHSFNKVIHHSTNAQRCSSAAWHKVQGWTGHRGRQTIACAEVSPGIVRPEAPAFCLAKEKGEIWKCF